MTISDRIRVKNVRVLSDSHYMLKTTTFEWRRANGEWQTQPARPTTAATAPRCCPTIWRSAPWCWCGSFAIRPIVNGYDDLLIEAAAGLLDNETPEMRIRAEVGGGNRLSARRNHGRSSKPS